MDAIITAGGIPEPGDPLYPLTRGENKALLMMAGKSMLQWVLDAVAGAKSIEHVVLIGLADEVKVDYPRALRRIVDQGQMLANMRAGAAELRRMNPQAARMLIIASDLPLITAQMVDWMSQQAAGQGVDILYTMVERSVMEQRFPGSKRTYTHLKGMDVCGGDMNAASIDAVLRDNPLVNQLIESRKNPLKQAGIIGVDTMLLMLARQLTLDGGIKRVARRLKMTGMGMVVPYAEMAMDVDKPFQYELVRADLEGMA
jgi:GTP:adenosylcobinamide-phosphate guanylyltransferase